jgi:hypothetical protein
MTATYALASKLTQHLIADRPQSNKIFLLSIEVRPQKKYSIYCAHIHLDTQHPSSYICPIPKRVSIKQNLTFMKLTAALRLFDPGGKKY